MIYLVSKQEELFKTAEYSRLSPEDAIDMLSKESILGADTETEGLDPYTKRILTIQLGTEDFQIVWDCTTYDIHMLQPILENPDIMTIWWNFLFDGLFLYHQRIIPNNIYDGFLAEKLMYLGYPPGMHSLSLKSAGINYCGIELDKSVRGKIINVGITSEVIVYAANDVKYEIPIYKAQQKLLEEKDLLRAIRFENEFVKCLVYIQYCGVKIDVPRWQKKMKNDSLNASICEQVLNDWIMASLSGKTSCIGYISTYGREEEDIERDKENIFYTHRRPELDKKYDSGATFEAYEIDVTPIDRKVFLSDPIKVNLQGDLWEGFDTSPKCTINWSSSKQVIPVLESLGFNLKSFDKVTKKVVKSASGKIIAKQMDVSSIALPYVNYKIAKKKEESFGQNYLNAINKVSGRLHANFTQIGTDTNRVSSGGGYYKINLQQLPRDYETRACFIAESGNKWISADYSGQESFLTADTCNDPTLIDLFTNGCKDMHSMVAKVAFAKEIGNTPVEEVKKKFKSLRQKAKSVEFTIFYGGNGGTISRNLGITEKEGDEIYNSIMKSLPGLARYQDYCRKEVMRKGYILLSPVTGHKAYIYDWDELSRTQDKFKDPEFWQYYRQMKKEAPECDTVKEVKHYFRRKSDSEKQSIDYRIQGRGSMCFKLFSIKLFNYLKKNNLLFKVKYCIPVHDEGNLEAPEEIAPEIAKILVKCMEEGAKPFCTKLKLTADETIDNHWVH